MAAIALLASGLAAATADAATAGAASVAAATTTATPAAAVKPAKLGPARASAPAGTASTDLMIRAGTPRWMGVQSPATPPAGYGPADLQSAYNLTAAASGGNGATVAIIGIEDDPTAEADLAVYRAQFGLPACTSASGCFRKVNESGQATPLPTGSSWAGTESIDLDTVSAVCPNCHLLLVETQDDLITEIGTAINSAVGLGAKFVVIGENSYPVNAAADAKYLAHPGIAITAPAGDFGYQRATDFERYSYPASSPYVTSVGGTTLQRAANARGWTETVWGPPVEPGYRATASGCDQIYGKPSWQSDSGCPGRTGNDVAADADPNPGVAFYNTSGGGFGWYAGGGTTVSAAIIGAVYALAGTPAADSFPVTYPYQHTADLYPVTTGTDALAGDCPSGTTAYLCTAGPGYNGPAGWGTPDGTSAFAPGTSDYVAIISRGPQTARVLPQAVNIQMEAEDSAGNSLTFTATGLPPGVTIDPSTGLISGTVTADYSGTVTVTATDPTGATAAASFPWSAENNLRIFTPGTQQTKPGTAVSLAIETSEPDKSATVAYSAAGLPPGLSINPSTGVISGTTSSTIASYDVTVSATDSTGTTFTVTFTWNVWNQITVTGPGILQSYYGTPVSVTITATDSAPGLPLTFSATGLPAGLSINPSTGVISGTPSTLQNATPTITVTDGTGSAGTFITGWPVGGVITLGGLTARTTTVGQPVDMAFTMHDNAPGDQVSFVDESLPPGLFQESSPIISGWPATPGTYHVSVQAGDLYNSATTVSFTWTVKPAPDSGPTGAVRMGGSYGKCLDDSADSSASGTKIQAWTCNGSAAQQWTVAEDGTLRIHGQCLDVGGDGKSQSSPVRLEPCTGTPAEQWVLLDSMMLQPSTSTVYCLLDPATSLAQNGVQLVLGTCKITAAQWSLPAGPVLSAIPGKCLDDYKGLTANGSKVDLSSCTGGKTQQWTDGTDDTIRIGGKCLTRHTANGTVGEVAHLWTCDGQANQHWFLFGMPAWESSPFAVHFVPATNTAGGLCLAAPASLAASPALVTTTATGCEDPDLTTTWRVW